MSRGQAAVVGVMIAVMLFLTVIVFIQPLKGSIGWARNADNLDCSNASISVGQQMTCIVVDSYLPLYIGFGIAAALAYIGLRDKVVVR